MTERLHYWVYDLQIFSPVDFFFFFIFFVPSGLVSWGCYNKWPQTGWCGPKTTEIYPCPVLEARSLKSGCQQGHTPCESHLCLPSFWWPQAFLGLWPHHSKPHHCFHVASFPVCLLAVSYRLQFQNDLLSRSLTYMSAHTPFPNKVTFWGSQWAWICEGHYSNHCSVLQILKSWSSSVYLFFFFLATCALHILSKNSLPSAKSWRFSPVFPSKVFFFFFFVYDVKWMFSFTLLLVNI